MSTRLSLAHLVGGAHGAVLALALSPLVNRACTPEPPGPYANLTRPSPPEPEPEPPRSSISGRIQDVDNNPIVGAWVCDRHDGFVGRCTQSDTDGDYHLDDLRPDTSHIGVSAATFEPSTRQVELTPGQLTDHVDIELRAGGMGLSGVVRDIHGDTIAGARLSTSHAVTFSDELGRFKLWFDLDEDSVEAIADGYVETTLQGDASHGPVELFLVPESVLVGRVFDAQTREAVEDAKVFARAERSVGYGSARTDEAGRFRIGGLIPGDYEIEVTGYELKGHRVELVHLGLAETSDEFVVRAHPAAYVTGVVEIADTGRPCTRGCVELSRQRSEHEVHEFESALLDDSGQVEFSGLLPGTYDVKIECYEHRAYKSYPALVVGEHNIGGIEWRVSDLQIPRVDYSHATDDMLGVGQHWTGKIRGHVLDDAGAPVAGLEIHPLYVDKLAIVPSAKTDANGEFELAGLPAGKLELTAWDYRRPEHGRFVRAREGNEFEAVTDQTIEAELVVESRRGTIVGVLHDEQGHPVADALVIVLSEPPGNDWDSLIDWDELGEPVTTDERGRFVLEGLAERKFLVHAYRRGGGEAIATSVEVGSELELTITPGSSLAGTITREDGSVPRSFYIRAENRDRDFVASDEVLLSNGTWGLNNLPAGRYEISVSLDEGVAQAEVDVEEGEVRQGIELRALPPFM